MTSNKGLIMLMTFLLLLKAISAKYFNENNRRPCAINKCNNGGKCEVTSFGKEICQCIAGFAGPTCDLKLNNCYKNPCRNGGRCIDKLNLKFECVCTRENIGIFCEKKNPCYNNTACQNGGVCSSLMTGSLKSVSFKCNCPSSFYGARCEKSKCEHNPCSNGGKCQLNSNVEEGFQCKCRNGFEGERCDNQKNLCLDHKCENGAKCLDKTGIYICICPPDTEDIIHEGKYCKSRVRKNHERRFINTTLTRLYNEPRTECENGDCLNKARNGFCDKECYSEACGMDGGDCGPWASCPQKSCIQSFKNNHCNEACNNANCLFDGFDCNNSQSRTCPSTCLAKFGDRFCHPECNIWECGFDGGDCLNVNSKNSGGYIIVELNLTKPEMIYKLAVQKTFLRDLSIKLRTLIQLKSKSNARNEPEIYIRSNSGQNAVLMYLTMNHDTCRSKTCFKYTSLAVDYLEASLKLDKLENSLNITKIYYGAQFDTSNKSPQNSQYMLMTICSIMVMLMLALIISFVIHKHQLRKTRIKTNGTWNPTTGVKSLNSSKTSGYCANGSELSVTSSNCPYSLLGGHHGTTSHLTESTFMYREAMKTKTSRELPSLIRPIASTLENTDGLNTLDNDTKRLMILDRMLKQIAPNSPDINETVNDFGETLLHLAARLNSGSEVIKRLLEAGCNIRGRDFNGKTPLASAVAADAFESAQFLLQKEREYNQASRLGVNRNGKQPLMAGEKRGRSRGPEKRETTPLITAIRAASESSALLLLNEAVSINAVDEQGRTALHWAAATNMVSIMRKLFLMKGAAKIIDQKDDLERTPIFLAVREGAYQACELLLDYNASVNIPDHTDTLPVKTALENGHHNIYELLLARCRDLCFQAVAPDTASDRPETCHSHKSPNPIAPVTPMDIDEYTNMGMPNLTATTSLYDSSSPDSGEGFLLNPSPQETTKLPPIHSVTDGSSYGPTMQGASFPYSNQNYDIYV